VKKKIFINFRKNKRNAAGISKRDLRLSEKEVKEEQKKGWGDLGRGGEKSARAPSLTGLACLKKRSRRPFRCKEREKKEITA